MSSNILVKAMKAELSAAFADESAPAPPNAVSESIENLVFNGAENCTLVALTNIAATCVDGEIETTLLTKDAGGLDFRSLYKKTTRPVLLEVAAKLSVPWTPSADPFVSNPFREARVDQAWVERRKNKLPGASDLKNILEHVSANRSDGRKVLQALANAQTQRLSMAQVQYKLPPRLTTNFVSKLIGDWLDEASGKGARLEHVAVALLRFAGSKIIDGWDSVESHHVNDPRPYDAVCTKRGKCIAIGECKDQLVTVDQINQLSNEMANFGTVRGYLFTRACWISDSDKTAIESAINAKSVFGYRIDVIDVMEAVRSWLSFIDQNDSVLPSFMAALTAEMDINGHLNDRRSLATLIDKMITGS
ncbi:restriction endonuclease, SacI family [Sphingobium yanoikuyae]|uniref:restriction endonuclease, SacI family n=1 Tax=Sphingobium yanoikuyae TaxID=13690 RepID=UPI0009B8295C|nr:restriction endonuclease, SacI family [Sphingobium yanoikuyae]MDV3480856.1 restriction endonuclease, SacI family [Sphingobium yanoikuyae]